MFFLSTVVKKQAGQSDDQLIALFRKKVLNDDILTEIKKREFYLKPSRARYEKMKAIKRGVKR